MSFLQDIASHLTPLEFSLTVIFGTVVAIVRWAEKQALRYTIRAFRNERQRRIHRHIHSGHKGSLKACTHEECRPEAGTLMITEKL